MTAETLAQEIAETASIEGLFGSTGMRNSFVKAILPILTAHEKERQKEVEDIKALIKKSDLVEVKSSKSGADGCGKPIFISTGTILRHKGHLAEVERYTKALQQLASAARKNAAQEKENADLRALLKQFVDWDKKYPKSRVHDFKVEKELDALFQTASAILK